MAPTPNNTKFSNFDLDIFEIRVLNATNHEQLRDILCLIYDELNMRAYDYRCHPTGFEAATEHDLRLAFYHTVNQMIII